jgi:hypothetical protein
MARPFPTAKIALALLALVLVAGALALAVMDVPVRQAPMVLPVEVPADAP